MISAMLWSISSTPAPWSSRPSGRARRSPGPRPRAGRPRARRAGRSAAPSRARGRRRAAARRRGRATTRASIGVARRARAARAARRRAGARLARPGADAERRHLDVLAHRQRRGSAGCAGTCGRARAAAPVRRPARDVAARELDRAGVRPVEAAEHVHERRLAGAVRADQPDDLAARELERDAVAAPARPRTSVRQRRPGGSLRASAAPRVRLLRVANRQLRSSGRPSRRPCRRASPCCPGS